MRGFLEELICEKSADISRRVEARRARWRSLLETDFFLIAEIKLTSLTQRFDPDDPVERAASYRRGGAGAISVVVEERFFRGSLGLLRAIRSSTDLPVLAKDFALSPLQVFDVYHFGADLVLLISSILEPERISYMNSLCEELGLLPLIEVQSEVDLEKLKSVRLKPKAVGLNSRDMRDLSVSLERALRLLQDARRAFGEEVLLVVESGIKTPSDVARARSMGARAVLVGSALMESRDPEGLIKTLLGGDTPCSS